MRFLDFNYADTNNGTIVTPSSENTEFPASNLGKHSPSRIWRSSGTFVITTSKNKINFVETFGGPEITATINTGTYTPDELETEIATQMIAQTLNARTYTVAYSVLTGEWTITGQTYLELLNATGTDVANSIAPSIGYAVSDLSGSTSYVSAAPAIHTEESVIFDLGTIDSIDSVAVQFSPLNGIQLTNGATLKVQANATPNFNSPAVDETLVIDDQFNIASHFFTTDQTYRYWRIVTIDPQNPNLYVELGGVVLAKATVLTQPPEKGFTFDVVDQSKQQRNTFGHEYVDEYPLLKSVGISYKVLQYADVKTLDRMFRRNGVKIPVMVVIDEAEDCFDKDHYIVWGKFQNNLSTTQEINLLFNTDLRITEIL
jgi:hypothetical protein